MIYDSKAIIKTSVESLSHFSLAPAPAPLSSRPGKEKAIF